jgi:hypothetical protein
MLQKTIEVPTDLVTGKPRTDFSEIAFHHLTLIPSVIFLLGLTAATWLLPTGANHFFVSIFWVWIKQKTGTSPLQ